MEHPLTAMIRLLAAPKLDVVAPGVVRAHMPFLKLIGSQAGRIDLESQGEDPGPRQWVSVIGLLLPPLNEVTYDTADARVDIRYTLSNEFPYGPADDVQMRLCIQKLVEVATRSAAKFMIMSRDRREYARSELIRTLGAAPIDMRDDDAVSRLLLLINQF